MERRQPSTSRFEGIQALRGIAAILVLMFHAAGYEQLLPIGREWQSLQSFSWHGFAGVDLFFVISGFIIAWSSHSEIGDPQRLPRYALRRFNRIMPMYWLCWFASAWVIYVLFADNLPVAPERLVGESVKSLLLVARDAHFVIPQAWTLNYEVVFYAVFGLFILLPRSLVAPGLVAWAALVVASSIGVLPRVWPLSFYSLLFIAGAVIGLVARRTRLPVPLSMLLLGICTWVAAAALIANGVLLRADELHEVAGFGLASALIVYGGPDWI